MAGAAIGQPLNLEAGRTIERALLMSELTTIGALSSIDKGLPDSPEKPRILQCFRRTFSAYVSGVYAEVWADSLTTTELAEGVAVATVPIVHDVHPDILANKDAYRDEARRLQKRVDTHSFRAAAQKISEAADRQALERFAEWVESNAPKTRAKMLAQAPGIVLETRRLLEQCSRRF